MSTIKTNCVAAPARKAVVEPLERRQLLAADLALASIDLNRVPAAVVTGEAAPYKLKVGVTNAGDERIAAGTRVEFQVQLVPEEGDPVIVGSFADVTVGNLQPGKTKTLKLRGDFPATLPKGSYQLVVVADSASELAEQDESNNSSAPAGPVVVDEPFADLAVEAVGGRLPAAVISGDGTKIRLKGTITNAGNTPVAGGATLSAEVLAMPAAGGSGIVVGTFPLNRVDGLAPGKAAKQKLKVELPIGLPTDLYMLAISVDPDNAAGEPYDDEGRPLTRENNVAGTDPTAPIDVTEGFYDVAAEVDNYGLPPEAVAGEAVRGAVGLRLINRGNVALPKGQQLGVDLLARAAEEDESQGTLLLNLPAQKASRLKPGASKPLRASFDDLLTLPPGEYRVSALADSQDVLSERDEDNEATPQSLIVVPPFVDLTARVDGSKLPAESVAGAPMDVTIVVRNDGNTTIPEGQTVAVDVFSNRIERGFFTAVFRGPRKLPVGGVPDVDVGGMKPGEERAVPMQIAFGPDHAVQFPYSISTEVDTANVLAEADEQNNGADAGRLYAGADDVSFSTVNQSMFNLGTGVLDTGKKFIGAQWNTGGNLFGIDVGLANAQVYGSTRGKVGVDFQAKLDTGTVDVDYADTIAVVVNEVDKETYSIKGSLAGNPSGSLVTRSPNIDIESNLVFDVEATVGVRGFAPFVGNFDESTKLIDTNGATVNLLKLTNRQFSVFGNDLVIAEPGEDLAFSADLQFNPVLKAFEPELKDPAKKPKKKPHSTNPLQDLIEFSAGDATVYIPNIRLSQDQYAQTFFPSISVSGQADVAKLDIDADFIAVTGALFAAGIPSPGALGATFGVDGLFSLEVDLLDFDVGPVFSVKQDFTFTAQPQITYHFSQPVGVVDPSNPQAPVTTTVSSVSTFVGQSFDFAYAGDDLQISTTYDANGTLRNFTDLVAAPQYTLDILRVGGSVLGLDLGSASVFHKEDRGKPITLAPLFRQSFNLGGFESVQGTTFDLDLSGGSSIVTLKP